MFIFNKLFSDNIIKQCIDSINMIFISTVYIFTTDSEALYGNIKSYAGTCQVSVQYYC